MCGGYVVRKEKAQAVTLTIRYIQWDAQMVVNFLIRSFLILVFVFGFWYEKFRLKNDTARHVVGQLKCWWYIHNIPLTGGAPSTCRRRFEARLEKRIVCQLLSFNTDWPASRFLKERQRRYKQPLYYTFLIWIL